AAKWLAERGSLEGVIANADAVTGMVGDNLRKARDWLPRARELLTIKCDVPLPERVEELAPRAPEAAKLAELLDRFELRNLKRELQEAGTMTRDAGAAVGNGAPGTAQPAAMPLSAAPEALPRTVGECDYETILTEAQLAGWLSKLEAAELAA